MSRIFTCYRRDDASGHAGRLRDALSVLFGPSAIFRDMETIGPGSMRGFIRAWDRRHLIAAAGVAAAVALVLGFSDRDQDPTALSGLSEIVPSQAAREGELVFDAPLDTTRATLRGRYGDVRRDDSSRPVVALAVRV